MDRLSGEDEDNFLPELTFLSIWCRRIWKDLGGSTIRIFAEYVDLTSLLVDRGSSPPEHVTYGHLGIKMAIDTVGVLLDIGQTRIPR